MQKDKKVPHNFHISFNEKLKSSSHELPQVQQAYFPYPPYPEQINLVNSIHRTITKSENALIQSPTGTGKTLCLLVGSLSALKVLKNKNLKIFYLTRTHSQISQVIEQIKKTCYKPKVNIIASRDHLCINPNLKELKGRVLEKVCNEAVNSKTCLYKQGQKSYKIGSNPLVIQQFKEQCLKQLMCPFFHSRQLIQRTQITILPFNYFLDWKIFQTFSHLIKNSVIIFDEAHNVDSIAEDGANLDLDCKLITLALNELKQLFKKFKFQSESNSKNRLEIQTVISILQRLKNSIQTCQKTILCSKAQLQQFMENSTRIVDPQDPSEIIQGLILSNSMSFFITLNLPVKLFYKKEIIPSNFLNFIAALDKIYLLSKSKSFQNDFVVKLISQDKQKNTALKLKCLNPSVSFQKIKQQQPRSIILSSGTLGNLEKWEKYLSIQFKEKLSIEGFINKNQLFAAVVSKSQSNYQFQFSFHKKDYDNQHKEVVEELKKIQNLVPTGNGIVVAFSTYLLMQKVIKYCSTLKKKVFYESKGSDVNKVFGDYSEAAKKEGAFMFIIMKGRFSEGINFSDYLCRFLVVVGVPFLPRKQQGIQSKMKYLTQHFSSQEAEDWYKNQTFQVVNQTIGRVIRSKKDYGVILLLDKRYSKKENFQLLSNWFKKSIRKCQTQSLYGQIQNFFKSQSWIHIAQKSNQNQAQNKDQLSRKTIKKQNKKHLKLCYDEQPESNNQLTKGLSADKNNTISTSNRNVSNQKESNNKRIISNKNNSNTKLADSNYKTPEKIKKQITSSASIVLSKINIEKKDKLKGFVNDKVAKLKKQSLFEILKLNSERYDNSTQQIQANEKSIKHKIKDLNEQQLIPQVKQKKYEQKVILCQNPKIEEIKKPKNPFSDYFMMY